MVAASLNLRLLMEYLSGQTTMNKKAYIQINNLQMNSTPFRYSQSPWAVQVVGIESPWVVRRNNDSVISKGTVKSTDIICTFWMSLKTILVQTYLYLPVYMTVVVRIVEVDQVEDAVVTEENSVDVENQ